MTAICKKLTPKFTAFKGGRTLTTFLDDQFAFQPIGAKVLEPGAFTTVQQPRPRNMKGYGVPPSGPLDDLSAISTLVLLPWNMIYVTQTDDRELKQLATYLSVTPETQNVSRSR